MQGFLMMSQDLMSLERRFRGYCAAFLPDVGTEALFLPPPP
jgi:hypothetical protein